MPAPSPPRCRFPPAPPVALALGRLHRNKGFDLLIRALPRLPTLHAVIAGDGPERAALLALAQAEGVAGRLHLLGWRNDQAALLAAATILVCPSRHEPLGNVVLEAFSAGRPVVAAAADGPRETVRPAETGLLVPIEDPAALALSIRTLLENPGFAAGLAAAARAEWQSTHAEPAVVAQWQRTLRALRAIR